MKRYPHPRGTRYRRYRVPVLGFCLLAAAPHPALCVEVDPARIEMTIPLDEPSVGELTVSNPGPRPVAVKVAAGAYRHFQQGLSIPSAQDWITFDPGYFTLAPGASTQVAFAVQPPPALVNDPAGECLAAIVVDELPPEEQQPTGPSRISVVSRLALPVYLMIRGRERVEVEITALEPSVVQSLVNKEGGGSAELLRLDTLLKNRGTVHTRPLGNVALFDAEGQIVRAAGLGKCPPLLPTAGLTVPTLLPLPKPGRYKAVVTVEGTGGKLVQRERHFEVTEDNEIDTGASGGA